MLEGGATTVRATSHARVLFPLILLGDGEPHVPLRRRVWREGDQPAALRGRAQAHGAPPLLVPRRPRHLLRLWPDGVGKDCYDGGAGPGA